MFSWNNCEVWKCGLVYLKPWMLQLLQNPQCWQQLPELEHALQKDQLTKYRYLL